MTQFLFKRSGTADKRPDPLQMALGEVDLNYNATTGGLFYKDSVGTLIKVGPAQVGPDAPNATPVGSAGNALGEFWYETVSGTLNIWDGTGWASTAPGVGLASPTIPGAVYGLTEDTNLNVALGKGAGSGITTGLSNVAIGPNVAVASATGNCQLAIGFSATGNWLTGDSTKAIKPGAGIIDCADSSGGSGQLLSSTGANKIAWVTPNYISPTALNASSAGSLIVNGCDYGGSVCFTSILPGPTVAGQILTNAYDSGDPGALSGQGYLNWCTPDYVSQSSFSPGALVVGCTPGNTGGIGTVGSLVAVNDPGVAVGYYQGVEVTTCTGSGMGALATVNVINGGYFPILDSVEIIQAGIGYALADQVGFLICGDPVTTTANVCSLNQTTICKAGYLSVGANGEVLTADSTCALGVKWAAGGGGGSGIPCACITGQGALVTGTAASTPTALAVGTAGQVLTVDLACSTGLKWATPSSASAATPTVAGTVLGVTNATNVGLGCNALLSNTGTNNTAIGLNAGCAITTGTCNVAIGNDVQVAVVTDSCQLALGFGAGAYWLTGDSTKAIKPGAGIIDCAASCGTAGQALFSDGANAVCWGDIPAAIPLDCVTSYNTTTDCGIYGGSLIVSNYSDGSRTAATLTPGPIGSILCYNNAFNGTCWIVPNFLRGNEFAKGSIAVGCAQVGGGVGGLSVNGTGNDPGVAVGYYPDIPLTGGSGTGATANISVINGGYFPIFEGVSVVLQGSGYLVGEDLTVIINGTTLSYTVNVDSLASNTINNYTYLSVGTDNQVLTADSACTNGVKWAIPSSPSAATPTAAGIVLGCTLAASTGVGCNALLGNTGAGNTAVGVNALDASATGNNNTAIGACALGANTSGVNNTAVGSLALSASTTGNFNVAMGRDALIANTTGNCNVAVGYCSSRARVGGSLNVSLGTQTFFTATAGDCNVAVGSFAGDLLTTGNRNVAIGPSVNVALPAGDCQLAIGFSTADNWLTGNSTKAIRPGAGIIDCAASTGTAGQFLMSNGSNAICWGAVPEATPLSAGILVGCTATGITAVGNCSLACLTTGSSNTAVGINALRCTTSGCCNAAFGINTLIFNTTGNANVAFGNSALGSNTTGSCNTAVGHNALANGNSSNNSVAVGMFAMCRGTANGTTAIGTCALKSLTTGECNTAVGCGAMSCVTTGSENVAVGYCALLLGTGSRNVALGSDALVNSNGCDNVAVGFNTLVNTIGGSGNVAVGTGVFTTGTGSCNIGIGFQAACDVNFPTGSNNIVIGCCAATPTGGVSGSLFNVSNRIVMGNSAHTCAQIQVAWSAVSDIRDKALDPAGVPYGLLFVEQLEPIAYRFCNRETNEVTDDKLRYGFSAQNVRGLEGDIPVISNDDNLERLNITDSHLLPVLVNAIKELSDKNKLLEERIAVLEDKA